MRETLLSPSNVILYGRTVQGLSIDPTHLPGNRGSNEFLKKQLEGENQELGRARLARIYAMSFEGSFYNLPKPMMFVVHGEGTVIRGSGVVVRVPDRVQERPTTTDSGMAARDFNFEASDTGDEGPGNDLRYWEYDKDDISLRLDVVSGSLEDILIDATLSATSKYAITSRVDLAARVDLAGRNEQGGRVDLASRVDLMARHRLRA